MVNIDQILAALYAAQEERDTARAELADREGELKINRTVTKLLRARLDAVITLCDSDRYGDAGSMFAHDIRAAATGE